jgi:hypothetical protein
VPEKDFLKYCKDIKRKSYYGFKGDEVKIILPNDTVVSPEEYWKSKEKKKGRWKPEEDEIYFFVDDGSIYEDEWMGNFVNEEFKYSIGNCFKTKKEAEEYKTKLVFQQQYRDYALEHNDEIDWNTPQLKQCAGYDNYENEIKIVCWESIKQQGTVYFTKSQDIWDFINLIGEENFKKYILEVGEN